MTDHVMVIPDHGPVRIGDGPTIETRGGGFCAWNTDLGDGARGEAEVIVDGEPIYLPRPYPNPVPIPGTPYEAYALASWLANVFAIRLRAEMYEPDTCPDGTGCPFHTMRHVHPVADEQLPTQPQAATPTADSPMVELLRKLRKDQS